MAGRRVTWTSTRFWEQRLLRLGADIAAQEGGESPGYCIFVQRKTCFHDAAEISRSIWKHGVDVTEGCCMTMFEVKHDASNALRLTSVVLHLTASNLSFTKVSKDIQRTLCYQEMCGKNACCILLFSVSICTAMANHLYYTRQSTL